MNAPLVREHVISIASFLHPFEVIEDFRVELCPVDVGWDGELNCGGRIVVNMVGGVNVRRLGKVLGGYNCDCDSDSFEVACKGARYVR